MKMNSSSAIIIITTLVVAAGAYWYFFTGTGNEPPLTASIAAENPTQMQFQILVGKLQPISFDTSIFADTRFNALVDLTTPIAPEPIGRLDPFAPIPGG